MCESCRAIFIPCFAFGKYFRIISSCRFNRLIVDHTQFYPKSSTDISLICILNNSKLCKIYFETILVFKKTSVSDCVTYLRWMWLLTEAVTCTAVDYVAVKAMKKPPQNCLFSCSALKPNWGINLFSFCCFVQVSVQHWDTEESKDIMYLETNSCPGAYVSVSLCFSSLCSLSFELSSVLSKKYS